jgi:uncharacterized protein (TIGR03437 family)
VAFQGVESAGFKFIRKYDATGTEVWTRLLNGSGHAVAVDSSGIYVVGMGVLTSERGGAYIRKYDTNGNALWTHQIVLTRQPASIDAVGVVADATGVYLTGFNDNATGAFVTRYDAGGTEVWTRQFGNFVAGGSFWPTGIAIDATGIYLCGYTGDGDALPGQANAGGFDAYLMKYDFSGNQVWARQFGSAGTDLTKAVTADATGVYVAGSMGRSGAAGSVAAWWRFDANGNMIWNRQLEMISILALTRDSTGIYVTGGATAQTSSSAPADVFVGKYDSNGNVLWTRQFGPGAGLAIAVDGTGVYVGGQASGALPGQDLIGGFLDAFVAKLTVSGVLTSIPTISSVVNGASFLPGIQNNSWITIRGTNLAPVSRLWDPQKEIVNGKLPISLDGVRVDVNDKPAVIYYISPTQINALAPSDGAAGPVLVTVTNANGPSVGFVAQMQRESLGFFMFSAGDGKYPAATLANGTYLGPPGLFGSALVTAPAKPHDVVLLYGTGCGPTVPVVPADRVFTGAAPMVDRIFITVGGASASVQFAGMSGSGLCQFNIEIPDVADGDQPLLVTTGGFRSQPNVFIAVKR